MNGDQQQQPPSGHTTFIVGSITTMGMLCAGLGGYLLLKGFQSGELLVQISGQAVAGLLGFLGGKAVMGMTGAPGPAGTIASSVRISNPPENPVPVAEQPQP